jgi:hypothetical protein
MHIRNIAAVVLGLLFLAAAPAPPKDDPSSHRYYTSSDGSAVHGPTKQTNVSYGPVTADCRDGTHSYSHHRQGTCSGHGGVSHWD